MKELKTTVDTILKGIGQIFLQDSAWTGIFFLIGLFYESILMGFVAILTATIGYATAKILKFNEENIKAGLYGFNATLVGTGLIFFFESSPFIWFALIIGAILSTLLMEFALRKKIPVFTFPFIATTAAFMLIIRHFGLAAPGNPTPFPTLSEFSDITVAAHAYGEVIFMGSILAGVLFFVGVFLKNPIGALYGFLAAVIAGVVARFHQDPAQLINDGLLSYSAVLSGIACSGLKRRDGIYVLLAAVIATYVDIFMMKNGMIILTFPFVVSMWVIIPIKKLVSHLFDNKIEIDTEEI